MAGGVDGLGEKPSSPELEGMKHEATDGVPKFNLGDDQGKDGMGMKLVKV